MTKHKYARVAQWWSIALPRRGPRVRIPSRALEEHEKRTSKGMSFFYCKIVFFFDILVVRFVIRGKGICHQAEGVRVAAHQAAAHQVEEVVQAAVPVAADQAEEAVRPMGAVHTEAIPMEAAHTEAIPMEAVHQETIITEDIRIMTVSR